MKIVLTIEEVKNIICDFVYNNQEGEKPKEVAFIHKFSEGNGETEVSKITPIDRVEVRY